MTDHDLKHDDFGYDTLIVETMNGYGPVSNKVDLSGPLTFQILVAHTEKDRDFLRARKWKLWFSWRMVFTVLWFKKQVWICGGLF